MKQPRVNLGKLLDWITCPECGAVGLPTIVHQENGFVGVAPRYQCDTPGCSFNREDGDEAWILDSRG